MDAKATLDDLDLKIANMQVLLHMIREKLDDPKIPEEEKALINESCGVYRHKLNYLKTQRTKCKSIIRSLAKKASNDD